MNRIASSSISLGFPVYNEELTVGEVLKEAHELMSHSNLDYEILVCDDGSTDNSTEIIKTIASAYPNFRVIQHSKNMGIHDTFEDLYKEAKKDFIFLNSTDKQWKNSILFDMLQFTKEYDIVIASRKKKPYGLFRSFISWCFNMVNPLLFGVRTYDAGAVKLMKREIIDRFKLVSKSPFSEAERLIRASRAGYKIMEYPVNVVARKKGSAHGVKPKVLLRACLDVFLVWFSIIRGMGKK